MNRQELVTVSDLMQLESRLTNKMSDFFKANQNNQKRWLKSAGVRKMLGDISNSTLQNLRIYENLPFSKIGGTLFYDKDAIIEFMKENSFPNSID